MSVSEKSGREDSNEQILNRWAKFDLLPNDKQEIINSAETEIIITQVVTYIKAVRMPYVMSNNKAFLVTTFYVVMSSGRFASSALKNNCEQIRRTLFDSIDENQ